GNVIAALVGDPQTDKALARAGVCRLAQRERDRAVCALLGRHRPAALALPVADGPLLDRPLVDHAGADGTLAEDDGAVATFAGAIVLPLSKLRPFDHLRVDCVADQRSDHEAQLRLPPDRTDGRAHPWEYLPRHYTGLRNTWVTRERYRSSSRRSITRPSFPFDSMKLSPPVARSETIPIWRGDFVFGNRNRRMSPGCRAEKGTGSTAISCPSAARSRRSSSSGSASVP